MTPESIISMRELDARVAGRMQISLLWCQHDDSIWVTVVDQRDERVFQLRVGPGEDPLDVFRHPFAYAPPLERRTPRVAGGT